MESREGAHAGSRAIPSRLGEQSQSSHDGGNRRRANLAMSQLFPVSFPARRGATGSTIEAIPLRVRGVRSYATQLWQFVL